MLTTDTAFDCPAFLAFWEGIQVEIDHLHSWDDGVMLDLLVDLFNAGTPVAAAAAEALEAYEIGQAEAWMAIPSWA
jgi:hypothetical protein